MVVFIPHIQLMSLINIDTVLIDIYKILKYNLLLV